MIAAQEVFRPDVPPVPTQVNQVDCSGVMPVEKSIRTIDGKTLMSFVVQISSGATLARILECTAPTDEDYVSSNVGIGSDCEVTNGIIRGVENRCIVSAEWEKPETSSPKPSRPRYHKFRKYTKFGLMK